MMFAARLIGTAKPMPMLPLRRGHDGAIDADQPAFRIDQRAAGVAHVDRGVGLDEILVAGDLVEQAECLRPRAETMPIVTVWPTSSGLPMANTTSPTRSLSLSASVTVGRFWASILMTATSVFGSVPMTLALNSRSSGSATFSSSAPSTTWLLVRM